MKSISFKSFHQLVTETPLPDDWDVDMFDERVPFAKRVAYAQDRAKKVGAGSSRIAYVIPFEGRQTVLKIAKNKKGAAQNEAEVDKLGDYYLKGFGITIPMIDFDEKNSQPTWIHTEFATKAKESDFIRACGADLSTLIGKACQMCGRPELFRSFRGDVNKIDDENELADGLMNLIGNYDVPVGDFSRLANWGVYNGDLVIIDMGLSSEVLQQHYRPKKQPQHQAWY